MKSSELDRTCLNRIELERSLVAIKMGCVKINAADTEGMICVQGKTSVVSS